MPNVELLIQNLIRVRNFMYTHQMGYDGWNTLEYFVGPFRAVYRQSQATGEMKFIRVVAY